MGLMSSKKFFQKRKNNRLLNACLQVIWYNAQWILLLLQEQEEKEGAIHRSHMSPAATTCRHVKVVSDRVTAKEKAKNVLRSIHKKRKRRRKRKFPLMFTYPEIGDANFKGALWTFKQQLALRMRVRCGISILLL